MNTDTLDMARYYDAISSVYVQNRIRDEDMKWIDFDENDDVLDVGCGSGRLCKMLSPRVNSVTGLDISPGMIEYAKMENSGPNIKFFQEDAQTFGPLLTDWRESFNKILSMTALHWCFDKENVLRNVFQCLKPGGLFLLGFVTRSQLLTEYSSYGETCDAWIRKHAQWGQYLQECNYEVFPIKSTESFLDLMRSVGFVIRRSEVKQSPWVEWKESDVKKQLRCLFYPIKYIPAEHHDDFIDDVYKHMRDVTPKRSGNVFYGDMGRSEHMTIVATKE
ncbi:juvenile hormone acid O-methyltransferase-like [Lytechinus variegatus]|uniref:juvenile hormone acid O-methyltransferase-like n=1 Tax=Lytechinus variegatus TaxID=7654 RepID=UPI001BB1B8F8|nr:juvenile hormone acid O-methyltransferase-like [Lytechinus variegatus]